MDFADDVAYSVHDVEDAVVAGHVRLDWLEQARSARAWPSRSATGTSRRLRRRGRRCAATTFLLRVLGPPNDRARCSAGAAPRGAQDMTSQLIGRFANATERATRDRHGDGRLTRYAADVVVPQETALEVAVLKGVRPRSS